MVDSHKPKVFIVGKTSSGKSTLCQQLIDCGFIQRSASRELAKLYEDQIGVAPSRLELAEYGIELRQSGALVKFHDALFCAIDVEHEICIDGIRFAETFHEARKKFEKVYMIYIDCPVEIRHKRFLQKGSEIDWHEIQNHQSELSVEKMKDYAGLIVDGVDAPQVVIEDVLDFLNGLESSY